MSSKFKSKWSKILKEKEPSELNSTPIARQGTFKLDEDVVDFLKPSTEKHVPKIDIAIAKRWPEAHEVRRAGDTGPLPFGQQGKPRRRKGLTVSFVKTLPDIIGEGGDEAPDPPREISRMKAMVSRSVSDRKPGSVDQGAYMPRSPPLPLPQARGAPLPLQFHDGDDFSRPQPVRRAQTSHNELSPPVQRKVASPPVEDVAPHLPSLGRVATGFKDHGVQHTTPLDNPIDHFESIMVDGQREPSRPYSRDRPTITTQLDPESAQEPQSGVSYSHTPASVIGSMKDYGGLSPHDAISPVAQKRREMSTSEGMMFRRASMLIHKDSDEDKDEDARLEELRKAALAAEASALSSAAASQPEMCSPSDPNLTPESAITPGGPNPFADPKYTNPHSREVVPAPSLSTEAPVVQSLPQQPQNPQVCSRPQRSSDPYQSRLDPYQSQSRKTSESRERQQTTRPLQAPIPQSSNERIVPQINPPQTRNHQRVSSRDENYMRAIRSPEGDAIATRQAPALPKMNAASHSSRERSKSPILRDRIFNSSANTIATAPELPTTLFARPNGSAANLNDFSPSTSHSRSNSRNGNCSPQLLQSTVPASQQQAPSPPRFSNSQHAQIVQSSSPRSSLVGPSKGGPSLRSRDSQKDYSTASNAPLGQPARFSAATLRQDETQRPGSASSNHPAYRSSVSPQPPIEGNPAADMAFADFAGRVAHMKGVFKLTAEKELPCERCTPTMWLRAGLWWYLTGKAGLEILVSQRDRDDRREFLTQAHVDLAKTWWILSDPLEPYDSFDQPSPQSVRSDSGESLDVAELRPAVTSLRSHLKTLCLSMGKNHVFPPTQSLIQGQDTRIWLDYPRFTPDAAAVLSGNASNSFIVEESKRYVLPYDMLPLGDTRDAFCYGRFPVEVYINTEEADTDRVVLPCMLTVLRGRRDYKTSLAIASQNELVNIKIAPRQGDKNTVGWSDVAWKASSFGMTIRLPRGFDLSVRMQERDFRAVWNLSEFARKVERSLRPEQDEKVVHEARLVELQYADSSNSGSFPADKVRGCIAYVYERQTSFTDGNGMRKLHRGYRMLLITDTGHKTLSSVSHEICVRSPLYFEYLTDSTANGATAMVIRIREEKRQCRILFVFRNSESRQDLYNVLNGLTVGPDEMIVGRMSLAKLNIEPASQSAGFTESGHPALRNLQWQKLGVTNGQAEAPNGRIPSTVQSDHLRIVARHSMGCITDRLNLAKGELRLRLPITDTPTVEILRGPQEDMSMSIDTRHSPPEVSHGIGQLLQTVLQQATIRTFTFASQADLHAFQAAITGFTVRYDGIAATFGISRRRMVVPIYKKWEASHVRLQIVSRDSVVQVLAFMEDFSHTEALCFQIKSTDTFEKVKGDGKGKKWGLKMVDAKFTLPAAEKEKDKDGETGGGLVVDEAGRRFVNLEGLEYAEEHDDITVGFENEADRDGFAQALPAATSVSRGITLKRRI